MKQTWSRAVLSAAAVASLLLCSLRVDAISTGTVAPEIGLSDLSGRTVQLSKLKGKVVLVDFWASWCGPCKQELPVLDALYKKHRGDGFEVIGVNQDENADNLRKFLSSMPLSFSVVHDRGGAVASKYAPPKMPSSFLIDRKGIVRNVHAGFKAADREKLDKEITALLNAK